MGEGGKKFVFVLGGARSGKSSFALKLGDNIDGRKIYLATARPLDSEMEERIKKHRSSRGNSWLTVEEPKDIVKIIESNRDCGVLLVDCLTLWLTNLMEDGLDDTEILKEVSRFSDLCRETSSDVVAVSNEVGLGIVPDNPLSRRFRDVAGSTNQMVAEAADEVYSLAAGIPIRIK